MFLPHIKPKDTDTVVSLANAFRAFKFLLKFMFLVDMNRLQMRCKPFASSERAVAEQTFFFFLAGGGQERRRGT